MNIKGAFLVHPTVTYLLYNIAKHGINIPNCFATAFAVVEIQTKEEN